MKNILFSMIIALGLSSVSAFANEPTAPAAAPEAGAAKLDRKAAKKACKEEGKKGKDLKACIKEKTGK